MFRLEKVFQNDDQGYVYFVNLLKSLSILLIVYIFSILQNRSIYQLFDFKIFVNSNYFTYSFILPIIFFFIITLVKKNKIYKKNFLSFLKEDVLSLVFSNTLIFTLYFVFQINFNIDRNFLYLFIILLGLLIILKLYFNFVYENLIKKNIIQRNIMLVGKYEEIKKILAENFDKINVFKCCLMVDFNFNDIRFIKSELKLPIFNDTDDVRSILEYHALGQIWILNGKDVEKKKAFSKIMQFSVDTLNVDLKNELNLKGENLLGNKFNYQYYEKSRFYGLNLFFNRVSYLIFLSKL